MKREDRELREKVARELIAHGEFSTLGESRNFENALVAADAILALISEDRQRLSAEVEGVLEPFARLAEKFRGHVVLEVCKPHPDNPSRRIAPLMVEMLINAASLYARLTAPAQSTKGDEPSAEGKTA